MVKFCSELVLIGGDTFVCVQQHGERLYGSIIWWVGKLFDGAAAQNNQQRTAKCANIHGVSIETQGVIRLSMSEKLKNNVYWLLTPCGLVQIDVLVNSSEAIIRADVIFHVGGSSSF